MDIKEAVLKEREVRKQAAIDRFAALVVTGEEEIARLEARIKKIETENEMIPDFNDAAVTADFLARYNY